METNFLIYFTLYCLIGFIALAYILFDKESNLDYQPKTIHIIPLVIAFIVFWPLALVKKPSTLEIKKRCPYCGDTGLLKLTSQNVKLCTNSKCNKEIPWPLDPGQKKIL